VTIQPPSASTNILAPLSKEAFLQKYWQKQPCLFRQAFTDFTSPVSKEDLFELAAHEEVESRIIIQRDAGKHWVLKHGPFSEHDFQALPANDWTLLIQQLDAWCVNTNQLKTFFDFIPYWRMDDIMASYAPEGGSVGPHYDQYDVFLLQASGKRRWQIGQYCDEQTKRLDGTPLRIIENFQASQEWVLEPGDMLYLPPKLAHYGVGLSAQEGAGDCITLSIGYKAPLYSEIISHYCDYILAHIGSEAIYEDPDISLPEHPHEITRAHIDKIADILLQTLSDKGNIAHWLGQFSSSPKNEYTLQVSQTFTEEDLSETIKSGGVLCKNEGSRFFFHIQEPFVHLFIDGNSFELPIELKNIAEAFCHLPYLDNECLQDWQRHSIIKSLLVELLNQGSIYWEEVTF